MSNKTKKAQVVIAAFDAQSRSFLFLLLQTNARRGEFWQNVTGKIEKEESYEAGALREAIEETALNVDHIMDMVDLGLKHEFSDNRGRSVHEKSFLIVLDQRWEIKIDPHEHQAFRWVPINEIHPEMVKYPGNFEALEKAQQVLRHWGG